MGEAPLSTFTTADLAVFERILYEIHGPHGREIQADVGFTAGDIYDAIAARADAAAKDTSGSDGWIPDAIDLAAIRVVGAAVLARCYEPEFGLTSGYKFGDVEALRAKATAVVRARHSGAGWTVVHVGDRRIQFPTRIVRRPSPPSRLLIAVPSATSWPRVYNHMRDASSLRIEAVKILADHSRPRDLVQEFDADHYLDLEQQATARAHVLSSSPPLGGTDEP